MPPPCLRFPSRLLLEAAATLRGDLRRLGSDLLWSQGTPEALVGRLVALAVGAGATRLALHHYSQPGRGSADLERTVAAAFAAAAARQGVPTSVQRYWGSTLHHPDDLPFAALLPQRAAASAGSCADGSSGGAANARSQQQELQHPQQQQQQQQQPAAGSASGGGVDLQQDRFACLPSVMSDFRRELLQARTPVRPPLSPPLAADGSSSSSGSSCGGSTVASAPVLPPLPAGLAAEAAAAGLAAPLPTQVAAVYAAAGPAAAAALARWEELSGQRCADLAPAGSGAHDPRSAVPFGMGEAAGLRRLRHFVGLDAGEEAAVDDHSVHGKRAADQPPPLAGYQDSRMLVRGARPATGRETRRVRWAAWCKRDECRWYQPMQHPDGSQSNSTKVLGMAPPPPPWCRPASRTPEGGCNTATTCPDSSAPAK